MLIARGERLLTNAFSYPPFSITSQCPPALVVEIAELQQHQSTEPILILIEKRKKHGFIMIYVTHAIPY